MTPDWTPPSVLTLLELNFHLAVLLWLPCSELTNGFESQPESSHHASPKHTETCPGLSLQTPSIPGLPIPLL